MPSRFTIDGSLDLEEELNHLCGVVSSGVRRLIPLHKMGAIVLGGGYGRGQGGVLRTENGDHPYNDLEFYIFLNGNRLWNEQKYKGLLHELGERLSSTDGLHVEFKIDSAHRLRRSPISMFSYDLVAAHRVIFGDEQIFQGCNDHLQSEKIPPWEAARLLFNR